VIECRGLTRHFDGRPVVEHIDLDVARGELVVLIGASGSGKTTLLKMLNRLIEPSSGTIRIDGQDHRLAEPHLLRRRIGYGAQRAGLLPHLDVATNVGLTPKLLGWSRERIDARVDALLERVRLDPARYRGRDVTGLSGGEQQRVSLARALAAAPPLLLLDEPFGALDPLTRDALQSELQSLRAELDLTVVFVTPGMSEELLLGDRIAFLDAGRIARVGTPAELLRAPGAGGVDEFLRAPRRQAERIEGLLSETSE